MCSHSHSTLACGNVVSITHHRRATSIVFIIALCRGSGPGGVLRRVSRVACLSGGPPEHTKQQHNYKRTKEHTTYYVMFATRAYILNTHNELARAVYSFACILNSLIDTNQLNVLLRARHTNKHTVETHASAPSQRESHAHMRDESYVHAQY